MKPLHALICSIIAGCVSAPALAALGGDATSVEGDRVSLKGALRVTPTTEYTVHEIQTPAGIVVREFVSPQGRVFAVTWRGRLPPRWHRRRAQRAWARKHSRR